MRREPSHTNADADEQHPRGTERGEHQNELLSFHGAPMMSLARHAGSPSPIPPRAQPPLLSDLAPAIPLAHSPLLERRSQCNRSGVDFLTSSGGALHTTPAPTAGPSPQTTTPGTFPLPSSASPLGGQEFKPFARWLSAEQINQSAFTAASAYVTGESSHLGGDGSSVVVTPVATNPRTPVHLDPTLSLHSPVGQPLSLRYPEVAGQSLGGPPSASPVVATSFSASSSSSSWRAWRLTLAAFCLLNAVLGFLFAWMMRNAHTAFAVAAVHRRWNLQERATVIQWAGVYYTVLGLILLVERASATVSRVVRWAGRGMRAGCLKGRHTMRVCLGRAAHLPLCVTLLRRVTRRGSHEEKTALLLSPRPEAGPNGSATSATGTAASEAHGTALGGGIGGVAWNKSPDGQPVVDRESRWRAPPPMQIRRRGN